MRWKRRVGIGMERSVDIRGGLRGRVEMRGIPALEEESGKRNGRER